MNAVGYFSQLPLDILNLIFGKLYSYHMLKLAHTCRYLRRIIKAKYEIASSPQYFAKLVFQRFNPELPMPSFNFRLLEITDICFETFRLYWIYSLNITKWTLAGDYYPVLRIIILRLSQMTNNYEVTKIAQFLLTTPIVKRHKDIINTLFLDGSSRIEIDFEINYDNFREDKLRQILNNIKSFTLNISLINAAKCNNAANFILLYNAIPIKLRPFILNMDEIFEVQWKLDYVMLNLPECDVYTVLGIPIAVMLKICQINQENMMKYCENPNFQHLLRMIIKELDNENTISAQDAIAKIDSPNISETIKNKFGYFKINKKMRE